MQRTKMLPWMFIILVMPLVICGCAATSRETAADKHTVTDLAGRTVSVPVSPKKVATMQGWTYELVFMLGGRGQIGLVRSDHQTLYPLALLTNPDLINYPVISGVGPQSPVNAEEFINKGVDLVIYWNIAQEIDKLNKAGIPVIVIDANAKAASLEESLTNSTKQIAFVADILGGEAPARYAAWKKYHDQAVALIQSRTAQIPADQRPIVYWGNTWNSNILATYTFNPRSYEVALCGGRLVSVEKGGSFPETTKEQLLAWQPDVIIVDNHGHNPEGIMADLRTNPDWASLPAVKENRIYRIPAGVFFIDKGTARPLFYYWLAKQLHPDLFFDLDLVEEMKYYYRTFYDYGLSTAEAQRVLAGWMEAGNR